MTPPLLFYLLLFLFGAVIGSFLNVCICRIPDKENIVTARSHCMSCGYQLKWYDLIPLASYLALRGRCRKCGEKISVQYPVIEALNGVLYLAVFAVLGPGADALIYCALFSALLTLSVIDFRTYEIPAGINLFILGVGILRVATDLSQWPEYAAGFFSVSAFLLLLYFLTRGRGIGGGDVKLMAVCGLVLGWRLNILAFLTGCIVGSVCHLIRMRVSRTGHLLALGPYLSVGVMFAALWGERLIAWYMGFLGMG